MGNEFTRTALLLGKEAMKKLAESRVAVFGIGGVGGYVVEALARSGVGAIDIIDSDTVDITNINRQILATHSSIGRKKVEVAAERIRDINPACIVTAHDVFFLPENESDFDFTLYDYVVDAIDTVSGKLALARKAGECGTPIICAMGAGNKLDPTAFAVADIFSTSVCPLARVMRRELKKMGVKALKVVYSKEEPIRPVSPEKTPYIAEESTPAAAAVHTTAAESVPRKVSSPPGSIAFVPPVMGLILASEVIKDLIR